MIGSLSLSVVAEIVSGQLKALPVDDPEILGVSIDTRMLQPGDLFIAIKGPRFNGHDYLAEAQEAGAVAALTEYHVSSVSLPQIVVTSSVKALGLLGAENRNRFEGCLVGITGSCGKTSVKEMVMAILSEAGSTMATEGNLNNALGTPLTLLRINALHDYAVVEMGTSSPGEIEYIANMARPSVSVIVNAAEAHLADLKSVAGVAQEKGFILDALAEDGVAVLNSDDDFFDHWSDRVQQTAGRQIISFSSDKSAANCFATEITPNLEGAQFTLHIQHKHQQQKQSLQLAFWGRFQVANACCAAAVAVACGLPMNLIVRGLERARPYERRGQRFVHSSGAVIIDESYNANPKATQAAVDQLADCGGMTVMVFGDMLELGDISDQRHRDIGRYAKEKGIEHFVTFGSGARLASEAFGNGRHFAEKDELITWLESLLNSNRNQEVSILVKGSKGMNMIEIVEALTEADKRGDS